MLSFDLLYLICKGNTSISYHPHDCNSHPSSTTFSNQRRRFLQTPNLKLLQKLPPPPATTSSLQGFGGDSLMAFRWEVFNRRPPWAFLPFWRHFMMTRPLEAGDDSVLLDEDPEIFSGKPPLSKTRQN